MPEIRPRFLYLGDFGIRRTIRFARITIPMGLRRRISVLVDDSRGALRWQLKYKTLNDTLDGPITLPNGQTVSKATYVWLFFNEMKASETNTFIINCLTDGLDYLVEFEDDEMTYEMTATRLYTTGINLIQVDAPDVVTLNDLHGSLDPAHIEIEEEE